MPETSLFMKLVVEPLSKLLGNQIKRSGKVAELANTIAKDDFERSIVIQHKVTSNTIIGLQLGALVAMFFYKKDDIPKAMNVLREEFKKEIEEVREENRKKWEIEHEKQEDVKVNLLLHIKAELGQNRINVKEDLKEIIINEVPGIMKKVLREYLKEINQVPDIAKNEGEEGI